MLFRKSHDKYNHKVFFTESSQKQKWPSRPRAKKRKAEQETKELDEVDKAILQKLNEPEDDHIMLFLRSLAPKIREVPAESQFQLQVEIMQCISRYTPTRSTFQPNMAQAPLSQLSGSEAGSNNWFQPTYSQL
jgi:hypothetical protein